MKTKEGLLALLERWREISLAEGQAIASSDWRRVEQCQSEKQSLQRDIESLSLTRAFLPNGGAGDLVAELISLESANSALLSKKRVIAENHRSQLERTSRNLRQVQRAYGSGKESVWNSYS